MTVERKRISMRNKERIRKRKREKERKTLGTCCEKEMNCMSLECVGDGKVCVK